VSAAAPLRRPAALRLPATAPPRATPQRKPVAASRPRLILVSQRRPTAGRLPFLIVVGAVLVTGLVSVLLLHMLAAQDAYRANAMQQRLATLTDQEQQLSNTLEADSSPSALRRQAVALGMRPTAVNSYHQLRDGRAIGVQTPVVITPPAPPVTTTTTKASKTAKTAKTAGSTNTAGAAKTAATAKSGATSHSPKHHNPPTKP
jgi:hypothetical protein